jgi:hypothetical protein
MMTMGELIMFPDEQDSYKLLSLPLSRLSKMSAYQLRMDSMFFKPDRIILISSIS